jgi:uncharacterized protein YlxP (DUF503 family)
MFTLYQLDKARNLRFTTRALATIEKKLNIKITKLDQNEIGINEIMVILWAGLQHEDQTLTVEKVMDLIDEYSSYEEASEKISEGFENSFSKKK